MNLVKECNSCHSLLSTDCFEFNKGGKHGLRASCIDCEKKRKVTYYIQNKEQIIKDKLIYHTNKLKNNPLFKLKNNLSGLIRNSMKYHGNGKGGKKTQNLLGCDIVFFKQHLESKFQPGMTWDNYGDAWTIDHICPCSQAKNEQELITLQHYSNLAPSFDNFIKSDKATTEAIDKCNSVLGRGWK